MRRSSAWADVTPVVRGPQGTAGAPGGGAWSSLGTHAQTDDHATNVFVATGIVLPADRTVFAYRLAGTADGLDDNAGMMAVSVALLESKNAAAAGDTSDSDSRVRLPEFSGGGVIGGSIYAGLTAARELLISTSNANQDFFIEIFDYVPSAAQGGRTDAEIQALIDATPLTNLQGEVADAQIPAAIMRDAEFTAAAVRGLLGLTAAEVNNLLTGGSLTGRTLTFTQNDGTDVTLTLPADQDTQDGVVESGAINAAGTELTLTLDTGTTVTISIPAVLRGGGAGMADGALLFGSGDPADALGMDGDAYLDYDSGSFWQRAAGAWTKRFEAQGVMHPIADDIRYFGWKTTNVIATADLDATLARVNSDTDDENEWPANADAAYFWVAVPESLGEPTELYRDPNPINQISQFTRQAGTIDDAGGVAHIVIVSNNEFTVSTTARPVRVGYA